MTGAARATVLSAKTECLSRIVPLSEAHLRRSLAAFRVHYHRERHHQGRGGKLIVDDENAGRQEGDVKCRERERSPKVTWAFGRGGLLRYYYRDAA